ncbi:MAG: hypothetical protein O2819_07265 [Planctomycetota bacterium]|nr:hypothetical protein [Planctomycetota bacterium]MDA1106285.1 hypothetical protein [Planctomycetota bacterium]
MPLAPHIVESPLGSFAPRPQRWIGGVRVLLVGGGADLEREVRYAAGPRGNVRSQARLAGCAPFIRQGAVDLVIVAPSAGQHLSVWECRLLRVATKSCAVALASVSPPHEQWDEAVHMGFQGVIDLGTTSQERMDLLATFVSRAMAQRQAARRIAVLEAACRRMRREREETQAEVGRLAVSLAEQRSHCDCLVAEASVVSEFRTLLSLEVEMDATLRTGLTAFVLRTGAANAALLLPTANGGWTVAAYLKSTRSRGAVEGMLRNLAEEHAPAVAAQHALVALQPNTTTPNWSDLHGTMFGWSALVAPCWGESRAEAVIIAFRDSDRAYEPNDRRIGALLARELGRVLERNRRVESRTAA